MTPNEDDNAVCPGCHKFVRHCTCGRNADKSRHFNSKGEKVVDESTEEFKGKVRDTLVKGGINLGHDLLDTIGDEFIGDKKKAQDAHGSKKGKEKGSVKQQCYFCKQFVDDLSDHECEQKEANVVDAEYEVVEESASKSKKKPKPEKTEKEDKDGAEEE